MTEGIDARIGVTRGGLDIEVEVHAPPGRTVVILGPNGAGKTTLLHTVAGLLPIDRGRIVIDGVVVDEPDAPVWLAPADRQVGLVFQDHLLFPHLSVLDNVAFGLRARGARTAAARSTATTWLDRFGVGDLAARRPRELSGGQQQRVALARALAIEPRALLLDEPLAALDAATRTDVRRELRRHLAAVDVARVLVTHDPADAMVLGDEVVVIEAGTVTHRGTVDEVAARPRTPYVAELLGVNLLRGVGAPGHEVHVGAAGVLHTAEQADGEVLVTFPPRAVSLHPAPPAGSPRNVWRCRVADVEPLHERARVRLEGELPLVAEVTAGAVRDLALAPGTEVYAAVKATELTVYAT